MHNRAPPRRKRSSRARRRGEQKAVHKWTAFCLIENILYLFCNGNYE